ncbi:MAG: GCN5-related N-acetyltransferase [Mucilaginibacter sp.]|nr:GCN5-related N-acetyltransferase [Mucilaginibacter sp.]
MTGLIADENDISVKRIGPDDIDLVIDLFDQYRMFYKQVSDLELARQFLTERLQNNESVIFVACIEFNETFMPIGFTQLYPKYSSTRAVKNWILNDLYVNPAYRKQGIGNKLIATATDFAKIGGAKFIQLETATDNYTAQHLYESVGFTKQAPDTEFIVYRKSVD